MTIKDQIKILDNKIRQNKADYDLYRRKEEVSILSSGDLTKYGYLTNKDLGYKPDPIQKATFENSPLSELFNKGLDKNEKEEGLLKRLKSIEDKTDNQLDLIRNQGDKQLEINKGVGGFYDGKNKETIELENRAIKETIGNMIDAEKVFYVKISGKPFNINKFTNLAYFGNLLFKDIISLEKAEEEQNKISGMIDELEKKTDINKHGRPLSKKIK